LEVASDEISAKVERDVQPLDTVLHGRDH
jgi:hypothetical protein